MACFMGHAEIVRELAIRGAKVNFSDNSIPTSPLSMAVRAGRTEVVKVLIEHGATVPEGMSTGLKDDELMLARWKAQHYGARPRQPVNLTAPSSRKSRLAAATVPVRMS